MYVPGGAGGQNGVQSLMGHSCVDVGFGHLLSSTATWDIYLWIGLKSRDMVRVITVRVMMVKG